MPNRDLEKQVLSQIEAILQIPIDQLVKRDSWGALNFENSRPAIESVWEILRLITPDAVTHMPEGVLNGLNNEITNLRGTVEGIKSFALDQGGDPAKRRNELEGRIVSHQQTLIASHLPALFLSLVSAVRQDTLASQAQETLVRANQIIATAESSIHDRQTQLDAVLNAARDVSSAIGVTKFATDFETLATSLERYATKWLVATAVLAVVTAAIPIVFLAIGEQSPGDAANTSQMIQWATSKIVLLVIGSGATLWAGRNYKALRHQVTVNRHRSNALKTFQAFTTSAEDQATKMQVLLEATRSIFAITPSGYLGDQGGSDPSQSFVQLIAREISPASSKQTP